MNPQRLLTSFPVSIGSAGTLSDLVLYLLPFQLPVTGTVQIFYDIGSGNQEIPSENYSLTSDRYGYVLEIKDFPLFTSGSVIVRVNQDIQTELTVSDVSTKTYFHVDSLEGLATTQTLSYALSTSLTEKTILTTNQWSYSLVRLDPDTQKYQTNVFTINESVFPEVGDYIVYLDRTIDYSVTLQLTGSIVTYNQTVDNWFYVPTTSNIEVGDKVSVVIPWGYDFGDPSTSSTYTLDYLNLSTGQFLDIVPRDLTISANRGDQTLVIDINCPLTLKLIITVI